MVVVVVIFLFTGCTNISGEAVRGGRGVPEKIAAPDNQQEEPKQVESELVFLKVDDINDQVDKTGTEICQKEGYSNCLFTEKALKTTYWSSDDNTCSSNIESSNDNYFQVSCNSKSNNKKCLTRKTISGQEGFAMPIVGDYSTKDWIRSVVCINKEQEKELTNEDKVMQLPNLILVQNIDSPTGTDLCKSKGYSGCLYAEKSQKTLYWATADQSCDLFIENSQDNYFQVSCDATGSSKKCLTWKEKKGVESYSAPIVGDYSTKSHIKSAVCFK